MAPNAPCTAAGPTPTSSLETAVEVIRQKFSKRRIDFKTNLVILDFLLLLEDMLIFPIRNSAIVTLSRKLLFAHVSKFSQDNLNLGLSNLNF